MSTPSVPCFGPIHRRSFMPLIIIGADTHRNKLEVLMFRNYIIKKDMSKVYKSSKVEYTLAIKTNVTI